ncbi:hypothetical protein B296_00050955, partial [Ensete ventricosum]
WLIRAHCKCLLFTCILTRKKKAVHKTTTTDDKRLQSTLKRIGVNAIPAIEEVNIFKDDLVIQFVNPKGNEHCPAAKQDDDDEDDVPELVPGETFEAAADENQAS